jgi:transketolase
MYEGHNEALIKLAKKKENIILLYADFAQGSAGPYYKRNFPDRIYNVGIAEANMMTLASGLAEGGKIPFTHCHSIFAIGRSYNQIRQIAFDEFNVKIILCNSGIFWTFMGASHQIVEDIPSLRSIPNLVVISPADSIEAKKATLAAAEYLGPVAIRLIEPSTPIIYNNDYPFEIGKAVTLKDGKDIAIISTGILVQESLEAAILLKKEKIEARVINLHTIKPLDVKVIKKAALETGAIVTVEESNISGGIGRLIAEVVSDNYPIPIQRIGVKDRFGQAGNIEELKNEYDLSKEDIIKAVKNTLKRKKS